MFVLKKCHNKDHRDFGLFLQKGTKELILERFYLRNNFLEKCVRIDFTIPAVD